MTDSLTVTVTDSVPTVTKARPNFHLFSEQEILKMVKAILKLRAQGWTYSEIDKELPLPKKAVQIIHGKRGKYLIALHQLEM